MKKIVLLLLATQFICARTTKGYKTFSDWNRACKALPSFEKGTESYETVLTVPLFNKELNRFFGKITADLTGRRWHGSRPRSSFYSISRDIFAPYVQKEVLPPGSRIAIHGDIHGDVHSLNRFISQCASDGYLDKKNSFKIKDPNFYMLFLGDYVDRGWYGAEVIYTILRLKNENPDQVFMVRGNHEEQRVNDRYGFSYELQQKFTDRDLSDLVFRVYNFLPLALYLGIGTPLNFDVVQCCHGGIELGFDPRPLLSDPESSCMLIGDLMGADGYRYLADAGIKRCRGVFKNNVPITTTNGFMWNDFILNPDRPLNRSSRDGHKGTIIEFGKLATDILLNVWSSDNYTMRSIFRAHQHGDRAMMDRIFNRDKLGHPNDAGVGKMWIMDDFHKYVSGSLKDIAVVTFSVAPNAGYDAPYHAYGILETAQRYEDWRLRINRLES